VLAVDYGDAPASFGAAGALLKPTWSGPTLNAGTQNLAGHIGTGTNCPVDSVGSQMCPSPFTQPAGQLSTAGAPAVTLGDTALANASPPFTADATGDTPDEDAFGPGGHPPSVDVRPGVASFVLDTARCRGTGYVAAWIDFNGNGTFDDGERSDVVACPTPSSQAAAPIKLTWSNVPAVNPPGGGTSFLRLRMSTESGDLATATRASITGEVEDWQVQIRAPQVSVTKHADVATVPDAGGVVHYTVTLTNVGRLDFTTQYPAYLADDVSAAADDATLGPVNTDRAPAATVTGNRIAWSGALPAGQSVTLTYGMTVRGQPGDRIMTNTVRAAPTAIVDVGTCAAPDAAAGLCATVQLWAVGLRVEKRAFDGTTQLLNGAVLSPRTQVKWEYVVTNTGSAPLRNVAVSDAWNETRTYAGVTVPTSGLTVITCPGLASGTSVVIPNLAPGASVTCTATRAVVPDPTP
jgi:hypothetical protein